MRERASAVRAAAAVKVLRSTSKPTQAGALLPTTKLSRGQTSWAAWSAIHWIPNPAPMAMPMKHRPPTMRFTIIPDRWPAGSESPLPPSRSFVIAPHRLDMSGFAILSASPHELANASEALPPLQHQRRPRVAQDAALQAEAAREVGGEDEALLAAQQAGEDRRAARLQRAADMRREPHQRPGQDVGEHQIVGRRARHQPVRQAVGPDEAGAGAVEAGVLAGDAH